MIKVLTERSMLDAYIIQKIKQEKETDTARIPIHIDVPLQPSREEMEHDEEIEDRDDRGVVIVDYLV